MFQKVIQSNLWKIRILGIIFIKKHRTWLILSIYLTLRICLTLYRRKTLNRWSSLVHGGWLFILLGITFRRRITLTTCFLVITTIQTFFLWLLDGSWSLLFFKFIWLLFYFYLCGSRPSWGLVIWPIYLLVFGFDFFLLILVFWYCFCFLTNYCFCVRLLVFAEFFRLLF